MIELRGISKSYRVSTRGSSHLAAALRGLFVREYVTVNALEDIDWHVRRGAVHGLLGRNGSGKSTLIKILCGILHPTSGVASVDGVVPWQDRRSYVRAIGVVFGQKSQLTWELPALDSFALQRSVYGVPKAQFEETLAYLATALDAHAISARPVRSLSLGERMRCEILCALLHRPKLLFLDEPTIGLDLISKDQVRQAIREINAELGTTIILTSHDISDVSSLCEDISLLDRGRFLYQGKLQSLLELHSRQKVLRVKLARPVGECALNGFPLVATGQYTATLTLAEGAAPLRELLPKLLEELPVEDMSVESTQLDEVVKSLYRQGACGAPR
jgi:ABC-2 type transport system ATP-binding protein